MQKKLFLKLAIIALLSMSLLVPLAMIEAQIAARGARQADVLRDIAGMGSRHGVRSCNQACAGHSK